MFEVVDVVSFVFSTLEDLLLPNGEEEEVPAAGVDPNEKTGGLLLLLLASVADLSFDVLSAVSDTGGAPKLKVFFKVAAGESNEKLFFSVFSLLGVEVVAAEAEAAAAGVAPNVKTPLLSFFSVVAGVAPNVKVGTTVGSLEPSVSDFFTGVGPNLKGDASLFPGALNENGDEVAALGLTVKLFL